MAKQWQPWRGRRIGLGLILGFTASYAMGGCSTESYDNDENVNDAVVEEGGSALHLQVSDRWRQIVRDGKQACRGETIRTLLRTPFTLLVRRKRSVPHFQRNMGRSMRGSA